MCFKFFTGTVERPSPTDWFPEDAVLLWADYIPWDKLLVTLKQKPKIWVPMIPNTNSMDGVFDFGNNNILIAGANEEDHNKLVDALRIGDIAVFLTTGNPIIHRIVEIKEDKDGKYFRFKGDNNAFKDSDKVRSIQILWISIGTIY